MKSEWELRCEKEKCNGTLAVGDRGTIWCSKCGRTYKHAYAVICKDRHDATGRQTDTVTCEHAEPPGGDQHDCSGRGSCYCDKGDEN